jgi:hypothetical protein
MTQKTFERVRRIELQLGVEPSHYEPGQASGGAVATDERTRLAPEQVAGASTAGAEDQAGAAEKLKI